MLLFTYYFNKFIRPILGFLRSLGIRVSVFVDDFLLADTESRIRDSSDQLIHTLTDLGFTVNLDKFCLEPSSVVKYLGFRVSCEDDTVLVKAGKDKVANLKRSIRKALTSGRLSARALARVCGQCISVAWAVTPGKLFLRESYRLLSSRKAWSDILTLTRGVIQEFS